MHVDSDCKDLYACPIVVCSLHDRGFSIKSLREAVDALKNDMSFLTKGNVFTEDQIEAYIDLKMEEVIEFEHARHPVEFKMYYSS